MEMLSNEEIKRRAKKLEGWFLHYLGSEDIIPIGDYGQAAKEALYLSRRFLRLLEMDNPDIAEADAILAEVDKLTRYSHSFLDLGSVIHIWRKQQLEQHKRAPDQ